MKKLFVLVFTLSALISFSQDNFAYLPAKPKPGDVITVTYKPAGILANTTKKVEGIYIISSTKKRVAEDLLLTKSGKSYKATIKTDTADNFIQLGFHAEKNYDNNFNEGYFIQLYNGDNPVKNSNYSLSFYHQYYSEETGVEKDLSKAIQDLEREFSLYPENKRLYISTYCALIAKEKKEEFPVLIQKEIEAYVKTGLKKESDYNQLGNLYNLAKLPEQAQWIGSIKKEKFPNGSWVVLEASNQLYAEKDKVKRVEMAKDILKKVKDDPNPAWKENSYLIANCKSIILGSHISNKEWDIVKKEMESSSDKLATASSFNNAAWGMQEKNEDLEKASELSAWATEIAKSEIKSPTSIKPDYFTTSAWDKEREGTYAMYADTYAMIQYKLGNFEKGYEVAKDVAIKIKKGSDSDLNKTYALLAEKVLSPDKLKEELEQIVKDGKATSEVKDILKKNYVAEKKSEDGFDTYITALERDAYLRLIEETKKSMLDQKSPLFALKNINGETVSLENLKGKVVIVDFWATWCGPCKASFPGMQNVVSKYKDNPNVQFLFVDTWERGEPAEKLKGATEFIAQNNYTFNVLMDDDNSVIEKFKVDGIPTKFIIDKTGLIRFKSVGYGGNDDKLAKEIDLMIELSSDPNRTF